MWNLGVWGGIDVGFIHFKYLLLHNDAATTVIPSCSFVHSCVLQLEVWWIVFKIECERNKTLNLGIRFWFSMFLGLCNFVKMHHQQRMAALGTDKELSDLLDFSAVRESIHGRWWEGECTAKNSSPARASRQREERCQFRQKPFSS